MANSTNGNVEKLLREIRDALKSQGSQRSSQTSQSTSSTSDMRELRDLANDVVGIQQKILEQRQNTLQVDQDLLDASKKIQREMSTKFQYLRMSGKLNSDERAHYYKVLSQLNAINNAQEGINKKAGALGPAMLQAFGGLGKELDSFIDRLPGGKTLTRLLGINTMTEQFAKASQIAITQYGKSLGEGKTQFEALQAASKAFFMNINMTQLVFGVIGIAAIALFGLLRKITKEAEEFATSTGLTVAQSKELIKQTRIQVQAQDNLLATTEDVLSVQKATIEQFGTAAMLTPAIATDIAGIGKAFGYGAEQAGKVNNTLMAMGASGTEAVDAQRGIAAEALKAGVSVGAVMKDISESSAISAKYFGGNVKLLAKSAVEAAKLGVSLQTAAKVADKLLDIEGSLAAQFEFMALSGRQINLDLARQLALEGDIVGATKAALENVGGFQEYSNMSFLERKKLAEAMGMESDELAKSLAIQEKMTNLTEDQRAAAMGLGLSAAEIASMSAEDLQAQLEKEQSLERASKSMKDMTDALVLAFAPVAEALGPLFAGIAEHMDIIVGLAGVMAGFYTTIKIHAMATAAIEKMKLLYQKQGMIFGKKGLLMAIAEAAAKMTGASAATLGVAAAIGLAAGGAAYAYLSGLSKGNDVVMGPAGYSRVLTGPEGSIALNDKDTIVAGTDLGGGTQSNAGGSDTSAVVAKLNELNTLMRELITVSRNPVPVQVGSRVIQEVGSAIRTDDTYRTQR